MGNQSSINMTCLIIDNYTSSVYFLDTSGWTNFFNTQAKSNIIQVIEKIFEKYFNDLSIEMVEIFVIINYNKN